jgi:hypothetical protein
MLNKRRFVGHPRESSRALSQYDAAHDSLKLAPAMAPGVSNTLWTMDNIVGLIDAAATAPKKRGSYKKRERDNGLLSGAGS